MSLTSFVKRQDVRRLIDGAAVEIARPPRHPLLVPPPAQNASLIGTAFDYLLRFRIARTFGRAHGPEQWIAAIGLHTLRHTRDANRRLLRLARSRFDEAVRAYERFVIDGSVSDELVRASLHLSFLDVAFRAGAHVIREEMFTRNYAAETADLHALVSVIPTGILARSERCLLNPSFGDASLLVDGADADFVIDDVLIDIKTVRHLTFTADMRRQLVGYYVLARLSGEAGGLPCGADSINWLGVYFSRFGYIHKVRVTDLLPECHFERVARGFVDVAAGIHGVEPSDLYEEFSEAGGREWWLEVEGHTPDLWAVVQENKVRFPFDPWTHIANRARDRRYAQEASETERVRAATLAAFVELCGGVAPALDRLNVSRSALARRLIPRDTNRTRGRREILTDIKIDEALWSQPRPMRKRLKAAALRAQQQS